jgi:hypothetical protein
VSETSRLAMAEQYADDRNLAARQSIFRFARPGTMLLDVAFDLAGLRGEELLREVRRRVAAVVARHGAFVVRTSVDCFVCS